MAQENIIENILLSEINRRKLLTAKEMKHLVKNIAEKYKVSERAVYYRLQKLVNKEQIRKIGSKQGAIYTTEDNYEEVEKLKIQQIERLYSSLLKYKPYKLHEMLSRNKRIYPNLFDMLVYLKKHYERVKEEQRRLIEKALEKHGWIIRDVYDILETAEFKKKYKAYSADDIRNYI